MRKPFAALIIRLRRFQDAGAFVTLINPYQSISGELVTERKALCDAISICDVHHRGLAERAPTLRAFALAKVATTSPAPQHLTTGCDFKSFGHGLLGFDAFRTSHIFIRFPSKKEDGV